ncbi:uncharacterized protein LOC123531760 [Mercenaria mercenaria]|uniref:uncharacterized protein LOC123531760 n=1 Tax=Mercenaria mercenaria TaxID=6596 RepID=UPI00234F0030|nr:uncharacterized protein LOC123531760 [Mercenaria mercenaria]
MSTVLSKLSSVIQYYSSDDLKEKLKSKKENFNAYISENIKEIKALLNVSLDNLDGAVKENAILDQKWTVKELLLSIFKQDNTQKVVTGQNQSRQNHVNGSPSIQPIFLSGVNGVYSSATELKNSYYGNEFRFQWHGYTELLLKVIVARIAKIIRRYCRKFMSQHHRNSSKSGTVFVELVVVTSTMFEEAMKRVLTGSIVLTYTNVFPSECRMFISVPIYVDGYIHSKDILTTTNL